MVNDKNDIVLKGFNTDELRRVSECLAVLNPARCPNVDGTMRYIAQYARTHLVPGEASYIETMGWCVCGFRDSLGEWCYKVTLSSYGVAEYIKAQARAPVTSVGNYPDILKEVVAKRKDDLTP